jgi:hypothetical protein
VLNSSCLVSGGGRPFTCVLGVGGVWGMFVRGRGVEELDR